MFSFREPRRPRRPSLTPMIDVVFLLLVFFMLAARFGTDMQLPLVFSGGAAAEYEGPPRLVDVLPQGQKLNGVKISPEALAAELQRLTRAPSDTIVLRPRDGAVLQRVVDVMQALSGAGFTTLVLVE
jgi:biopolymer transport protein ExbD